MFHVTIEPNEGIRQFVTRIGYKIIYTTDRNYFDLFSVNSEKVKRFRDEMISKKVLASG
jgi:hypothetical protein